MTKPLEMESVETGHMELGYTKIGHMDPENGETFVYLMDVRELLGRPWTAEDESRGIEPGEGDLRRIEELSEILSRERQEKIRANRFLRGKLLSLGAGLLLDYGLRMWRPESGCGSDEVAGLESVSGSGEPAGLESVHSLEEAVGLKSGCGSDEVVPLLRERDVTFVYGEQKKPCLRDYPHLHFNLSHSGTMAMAAFAGSEVGCDIEEMRKPNYQVVKRFFAPEEIRQVEKEADPEKKRELFYRFWTLKESFIKATGEGMQRPLDGFAFQLPRPSAFVSPGGEPLPYEFEEYSLPGYRAALCQIEPGRTVQWRVLSADDILRVCRP